MQTCPHVAGLLRDLFDRAQRFEFMEQALKAKVVRHGSHNWHSDRLILDLNAAYALLNETRAILADAYEDAGNMLNANVLRDFHDRQSTTWKAILKAAADSLEVNR